jgi:hypothetical protein
MIAALAFLSACTAEEAEGAAAEAPAPVRPVEVVADEEGAEDEANEAESEELTRLRARVTELESQLATCQREAAAVPTGVDPPAQPAAQPATQTASAEPAAERRDAGPRRRRDDGTIRIDPAGILLGR